MRRRRAGATGPSDRSATGGGAAAGHTQGQGAPSVGFISSNRCDLEELASLFGVTEKTIRAWIRSGMPVEVAGKRGRGVQKTQVSLRKAVEWYFTENFERLELDRQRTRLAEEQADRLADEKAVRRAELIPLADVAGFYGDHIVRARARLIQIPDALGQFCPREEAGELIAQARRLVTEALAELAAGTPPRSAAPRAALDTAAGPDGEPMGGSGASALERKQRRAGTVAD